MYYIRSRIALTRAEKMLAAAQTPVERTVAETEARRLFKLAEKDAQLLLEQFPGWSEITNVYRVLAYAALQHRPPQYRAAAAFLIQFRDQSEDLAERQALNRQIGDCYFLNEDYRNAVEFYESAASDESPDGYNGALFLRLVTAQVRGGQIESALQLIDEVNFSESISPADRWRAEWNVVQALQANGRLESALKRVRVLLEGDTSRSVPIALDLRLRWLEVRLSLLAGDQESVKDRVNALLLRVESIPEQALNPSPAEIRLLVTEVLLLKADILIQLGDSAAGMEVLAEIRAGYPESSAAERSYLTEADYHASINEFEVAQSTLLKLSSLYENSDLAPQALFEAGLYCELRGAAYFAEAVRLHQNLIERYPVDPLLFSARLKQGDLLRQMNDFAGAQIIYEDLIRSFPEHPRRYVAELSRADCMLALAKRAEGQLKDVAMALERMIDLPNLPVDFQAEVGYKWGFALLQRDALKEAQEVFMLMAGRFLLDGENATRLGVTGRYWMSRAMLELGSLLEEAGELAEARRVYRKMVAYNLPGRTIAQSRADRLPVVAE
jgi:tetratricopeptide (TPR) repeat protein